MRTRIATILRKMNLQCNFTIVLTKERNLRLPSLCRSIVLIHGFSGSVPNSEESNIWKFQYLWWCASDVPRVGGDRYPGTWWLSRASILWHQWHECPALSGLAIRDWSNIFRPRLIEIFDLDVSYDEPCRYVGREERGNLESVISRSNSTNVIYPGSLASVTWLIQE